MNINKVVHMIIRCEKCHKMVTQYLNEDPVFEVVRVDDKAIDMCCSCADKHYEKENE